MTLPYASCSPGARPYRLTIERRSPFVIAPHTAALPRSPLGRIAELTSQDPYREVDASAVLARLAGTSLRRTPGTGKPSYSNFGFAVLGLALAAVTGYTYERALRERVLGPLGLEDTTFDPSPDQLDRHARGHRWRRRPARPWQLDAMNSAGGLHSTAADLSRFLDQQLRPGGTSLMGVQQEVAGTGQAVVRAVGR